MSTKPTAIDTALVLVLNKRSPLVEIFSLALILETLRFLELVELFLFRAPIEYPLSA